MGNIFVSSNLINQSSDSAASFYCNIFFLVLPFLYKEDATSKPVTSSLYKKPVHAAR